MTTRSIAFVLTSCALAACSAQDMEVAASKDNRSAGATGGTYANADVAGESYASVKENAFINAAEDPVSTFSIDVDTASYSNARRFINSGSLPPPEAVRVEEFVNYFPYSDPAPTGGEDLAVKVEAGPSPYHPGYSLARIAVKAKDLEPTQRPSSNLVFLLDVSGSMSSPDKLPLVKRAMQLVVAQLSEADRVSIVTYAGADQVVLQPTSGDQKLKILRAIEDLESGGSTNGAAGIHTAYQLAAEAMRPGGNNRVILATDGDFNVGVSDLDGLEALIEAKRATGVYLTVLGFGTGNLHDDTMELLADKGNGNYAYIDSILEARKVLVTELGGSFFTVGKDVKLQVAFNPKNVGAYRLIGYENRLLNDEDFDDDEKDAGEIGAGHTVTALYELIPAGNADSPSLYSYTEGQGAGQPLLTVKLRYKPSGSDSSQLIETALDPNELSIEALPDDFRFAAAVAGFGMLLKDSKYTGSLSWASCEALAAGALGADETGYRAELLALIRAAEKLQP